MVRGSVWRGMDMADPWWRTATTFVVGWMGALVLASVLLVALA